MFLIPLFQQRRVTWKRIRRLSRHLPMPLQKGMDYVQEHSAEEIAKCIAPQFAETESDTLTAIVARYQEQDTWKEDLIFHKDAFDLLQNILEDSDVLKERVPYEALVTTEFAEKATAR